VQSNIDFILSQLEGVKQSGAGQWISRCPAHEDRSPSLAISIGAEGQVLLYCFRGCNLDEIVSSLGIDVAALWPDSGKDISPEERRLRKVEAEQKRIGRELEDQRDRLAALERIHQCSDHIEYYNNLRDRPEAIEYWLTQGMEQKTIDSRMLGYCHRCRMDYPEMRPSYTIPVMSNGTLWNIRHRLIGEEGSKYRPHIKGLPNVLFNADDLRVNGDQIIIVEGEKKSLMATQHEWLNVGIMGKRAFKKEWADRFKKFKRVVVALDPDAEERAVEIAGLLGRNSYIAELPEKLDDMLNPYGDIRASRADVEWFFQIARKAG
jgi:hypothetical protein